MITCSVSFVLQRDTHLELTPYEDSRHVTMKDYTINASSYRKYNTFSDRESESEQKHRTMTLRSF